MKARFQLNDIAIEGHSVGKVEVEVEYSLEEMKLLITEMPELITKLMTLAAVRN